MGRTARGGEGRADPRRAIWAMARALDAPELTESSRDRLTTAVRRARLVLAPTAVVLSLVGPGLAGSERGRLALAVGVFYLPFVAWSVLVAGRRRSRVVLGVEVVGDVVAIFAVSLVAPLIQVIALTGYTIFVAYFTVVYGRTVGVPLALLAIVLAVTADLLGPHGDPPDAYALAMFGVGLLVIAVLVDLATVERRRSARFLVRLQHAIRQVPFKPGLQETLDAISTVARDAVDAKFVSVLVRDGDTLVQGALEGDLRGRDGVDRKERSQQIIRRILEQPESSPSGLALTEGQLVVVTDVRTDPRFSHWVDEAARQRFTSTIAVPLRTGGDVVGVLAAYFRSPVFVSRDRIALLQAYAEHVTLVILRALAFEHERRAAEQLSEAARLKSELVATVSHELRTPLTSVKGFLDTVLRHWDRLDDSERRRMLGRAARNADILSDLVDQVLDYSHLEAGGIAVEPVPSRVAALVESHVEVAAPLLAAHRVVADVPTDLWVDVDPLAFDRVLSNLLGNAVRYAPAGSTVTVDAVQVGDEVQVAVADEGPGIRAEEQPRIFERFERGRGATEHRGAGLGLAIVRHYVEVMGGRVWVESELGQGSTFRFTLPVPTSVPETTTEPATEVVEAADVDGADGPPTSAPAASSSS